MAASLLEGLWCCRRKASGARPSVMNHGDCAATCFYFLPLNVLLEEPLWPLSCPTWTLHGDFCHRFVSRNSLTASYVSMLESNFWGWGWPHEPTVPGCGEVALVPVGGRQVGAMQGTSDVLTDVERCGTGNCSMHACSSHAHSTFMCEPQVPGKVGWAENLSGGRSHIHQGNF